MALLNTKLSQTSVSPAPSQYQFSHFVNCIALHLLPDTNLHTSTKQTELYVCTFSSLRFLERAGEEKKIRSTYSEHSLNLTCYFQ